MADILKPNESLESEGLGEMYSEDFSLGEDWLDYSSEDNPKIKYPSEKAYSTFD